MPRYVAFLRAINVGQRRVTMDRLRSLFVGWGYDDVWTFIASGNVVLQTSSRSAATLSRKISAELEAALGYEATAFVRPWSEVEELAAGRYFPEQGRPQVKVYVGFLAEAPSSDAAQRLRDVRSPADAFLVEDSRFFWRRRVDLEKEDIWTKGELRGVKLPLMTVRNLDTLQKLARAGATRPSP